MEDELTEYLVYKLAYDSPNAELCGNFGAAKRWKNCPATAAGYALFVVTPEPENFHHSLVLEHLVDQTMLNINTA